MNRTENEIRNAFQKATPNVLDSVLSHDCHEKGIVVPVTKRKFGSFMLRKIITAVVTLALIAVIVAVGLLFLHVQASGAEEQVTIIGDGSEKYILLPASKTQVCIPKDLWGYLDSVDYELLKAADAAILEKIASHRPKYRGEHMSPFYYGVLVYEGELCLQFEMIALPEQDTSAPCGDHIHVFGSYPITK